MLCCLRLLVIADASARSKSAGPDAHSLHRFPRALFPSAFDSSKSIVYTVPLCWRLANGILTWSFAREHGGASARRREVDLCPPSSGAAHALHPQHALSEAFQCFARDVRIVFATTS